MLSVQFDAYNLDSPSTVNTNIRYGIETIETYFRQTRAVRPLTERLRDHARLVQAVDETLGALAKAGR